MVGARRPQPLELLNMSHEIITWISTPKAVECALEKGYKVSRPTVVSWCTKHKLGHQHGKGGKWQVNKDKFMNFIEGIQENEE